MPAVLPEQQQSARHPNAPRTLISSYGADAIERMQPKTTVRDARSVLNYTQSRVANARLPVTHTSMISRRPFEEDD